MAADRSALLASPSVDTAAIGGRDDALRAESAPGRGPGAGPGRVLRDRHPDLRPDRRADELAAHRRLPVLLSDPAAVPRHLRKRGDLLFRPGETAHRAGHPRPSTEVLPKAAVGGTAGRAVLLGAGRRSGSACPARCADQFPARTDPAVRGAQPDRRLPDAAVRRRTLRHPHRDLRPPGGAAMAGVAESQSGRGPHPDHRRDDRPTAGPDQCSASAGPPGSRAAGAGPTARLGRIAGRRTRTGGCRDNHHPRIGHTQTEVRCRARDAGDAGRQGLRRLRIGNDAAVLPALHR